jgi:hypothetical protein
MAGLFWRATSGGAIALTGGSAKTVCQIDAASNHREILREVALSFDGTSPTNAPGVIRFLRQTTDGTMTSVTPVLDDSTNDETIQAVVSKTATVEPTAGNVLDEVTCHPQSNILLYPNIVIPGGTKLGIECNFPDNVNVRWRVKGEE